MSRVYWLDLDSLLLIIRVSFYLPHYYLLHPFSIHNLSCLLVVRDGSLARPVALRNISYTDTAVVGPPGP